MPKLPGVNHLDAIRALHRLKKHVIMSNGSQTLIIPRHNPINANMVTGTQFGPGLLKYRPTRVTICAR